MKVLLVEPEYYTKYPPLPLMKMSTWHKEHGNDVQFIKGHNMFMRADVINITSLFTYEWEKVHTVVGMYKLSNPKATINLGGIYASLMPDLAAKSGARIHQGLVDQLENCIPDYSLFPEWKESIVHASRGCVRKCEFCGVKNVEPKFTFRKSIKEFIKKEHEQITFFDNNFLANPHSADIVQELIALKKPVDFNQGLDIRLLKEDKAKMLAKLEIKPVRFAFDSIDYKDDFIRGIELANKYELGKKHYIMCYMLYNFKDKPIDLIERLKICCDLNVRIYLMRYAPIFDPDYEYIGEHWTKKSLASVDRFWKIIQSMGTINPASYVYVKLPLNDYIKNLNLLWDFDAAATNTAAQRSLFETNSK